MKQQEQEARGKRPGVVVAAGGGKKEGRRGAPPCAAPLSLVSSIIQEYQLAAVMRLSGDRKGKALSRQMVFSSLQARPARSLHSQSEGVDARVVLRGQLLAGAQAGGAHHLAGAGAVGAGLPRGRAVAHAGAAGQVARALAIDAAPLLLQGGWLIVTREGGGGERAARGELGSGLLCAEEWLCCRAATTPRLRNHSHPQHPQRSRAPPAPQRPAPAPSTTAVFTHPELCAAFSTHSTHSVQEQPQHPVPQLPAAAPTHLQPPAAAPSTAAVFQPPTCSLALFFSTMSREVSTPTPPPQKEATMGSTAAI